MTETLVTLKVSVVLLPIMTDITTRDRIKKATHDMVMQYGIRSVSMDDIATALGISKKTIYQYFSDKDELVAAVVQDLIQYNQQCCTNDRSIAKDAVHEVFLAMQMMQEMFENMNPSILYDLEKFHPGAFALFREHKYNFLYQVLKENFERGIREELFRDDLVIEVMIKTRLECMMLAFNQQIFPKNKFRLVDVETQLTEHYLFGIASLKGFKLILKYKQERNKQTNGNEKIMAK